MLRITIFFFHMHLVSKVKFGQLGKFHSSPVPSGGDGRKTEPLAVSSSQLDSLYVPTTVMNTLFKLSTFVI